MFSHILRLLSEVCFLSEQSETVSNILQIVWPAILPVTLYVNRVTFKGGGRRNFPGSKFSFPLKLCQNGYLEGRGNFFLSNLLYAIFHTYSLSCIKFIVLWSKKAKFRSCGAASPLPVPHLRLALSLTGEPRAL